MKFCSLTMSAQNETEVESLLMSPCWSQAHAGPTEQYLLDGHKLLLDHDLDSLPSSDTEGQKSTIEVLDNLLMSSHQSLQTNLAELKPLPPFTGYTGHLSINGISGHHYHAIAQRLPDDNNNNLNHGSCLNHSPFSQSTSNGPPSFNQSSNNNHGSSCPGQNSIQQPLTPNSNCSSTSSPTDHNIVSSSTCLADSVLHPDEPCLHDVKLFSPDSDSKMYNVADSCVMANGNNSSQSNNNNNNNNGAGNRNMSSSDHRMADSVSGLKIYTNESKELTEYDMSSIEDIAAIIGSAIADTTVPNRMDGDADTNQNNDSRDSWMDLDAWIDGACVQTDGKLIISHQDSLGDYVMPQSPHSINGGCPNSGPILPSPGSTLQNLLTHGYMPLLQNRLQNGPPNSKGETPSSTSYGGSDLISTSTSPPGSVVSTTDNIIMGNGMNGSRFMGSGVNNQHHYQLSMNIKADGLCSPDLVNNNNSSTNNNNYPHTTTILGNSPPNQQSSKMKRSRVPKHKLSGNSQSPGGGRGEGAGGGMGNGSGHLSSSGPLSPSMNLNFQGGNDLSGLLGKEKPVHRCNICNRGFLNKSNIKVHLRTHTGEKPFRCDVCSKAFRQKAHLIKHQQIHKRIGRD